MDPLYEAIAIDEIRNLKSRYFYFLDTKSWTNWGEIFSEDATFDLRSAFSILPMEGETFILHGRERIVDVVRDGVKGAVTVHHGSSHEVSLETPTDATGRLAFRDIIRNSKTGKLYLEGYGHYHESYRLVDAKWHISHSRISRIHVMNDPEAQEI